MKTPLNVALVGGGRIADLHAPGYLRSPNARLYALCDVSPHVLARRKCEWGLEATFTSYDALLADQDIDIVEILTPHHLHHPMVLKAAAAKKHVSVQKPMALSLQECDEMIEACSRAGVHLKVFENFVFYPPYLRAREVVRNGEIGEPLCIRTRLGSGYGGWEVPLQSWAWRLNEAEGGKGLTIFDDGFHKFSVAVDFFGPVNSITGWIDRTIAVVDMPAALAWTHRNGQLGYMDTAMTPNFYVEGKYYPADERVEITGSRGVVHVTTCTGRPTETPPLIVVKNGRVEAHTDLRYDWLDSFSDSVQDFIDAVLTDRPPHLTGERGRDVTAVALAAIEAARTGKSVRPETIEMNTARPVLGKSPEKIA
jgi:predicted dehydrogenase